VRPAAAFGVAAMVGWGIAYVPSAWLVERWPPLVAAGARLTLAGLVLLGALALSGRPVRPGAGPMTIGWLALTQTVLFYGATFWGIALAGAGLAAVLANTDPLFAPAAEVSIWFFLVPVIGVASAWPLLGEVPQGRLLVGLAGVSVGLWLVMSARAAREGGLVDSAAPP
jgi:drug/metabolite transporter (DMT)-like permease